MAQLLTDYPSSTSFVFYIKGRASTAAPITGALAGANGSYAEGDLTQIIKFTYDVASKSISYSTASSGGGGTPPAP
jgi:hypothetical protein